VYVKLGFQDLQPHDVSNKLNMVLFTVSIDDSVPRPATRIIRFFTVPKVRRRSLGTWLLGAGVIALLTTTQPAVSFSMVALT